MWSPRSYRHPRDGGYAFWQRHFCREHQFRNSLAAGDAVTAYVFAAKNGATVGNLDRIVKADGTELKR
jgi:hypothetical protein